MEKNYRVLSKKGMGILLVTSLLATGIGAASVFAKGEEIVKKNVLMAETEVNKNSVQEQTAADQPIVSGQVTESQAIEITENALKSLFNVDASKMNVKQPIADLISAEGVYGAPVWNVFYAPLNPQDDKATLQTYGAIVNSKTGDVLMISSQTHDPNQKSIDLSFEEAQDVAAAFMKSNELVEGNVKDITLAVEPNEEGFIFKVTQDNGKESYVKVSKITGEVTVWRNL